MPQDLPQIRQNNWQLKFALQVLLPAVLLLAVLNPDLATADWASSSGAERAPSLVEISVRESNLALTLRISTSALIDYQGIFPSDFKQFKKSLTTATLKKFASDYWQIVTNDGLRLVPTLKSVSTAKRILPPAESSQEQTADETIEDIVLEFNYPLAAKPDWLIITPPLDSFGFTSSSYAIVALHDKLPIIDYQYITGPEKVSFNWDDPWQTKFENSEFTRHHNSALASFIYIEPYEVRHEVLLRLSEARAWLSADFTKNNDILPQQFAALKRELTNKLREDFVLELSGKKVSPRQDKVSFLQQTTKGLEELNANQILVTKTAMVGLIFQYPTAQPSTEVKLRWKNFPQDISEIPLEVFSAKPPTNTLLSAAKSQFIWRSEKLPTPALYNINASDPPTTDQELSALLNTLFSNLYRTFDLLSEEAAYDQLATVVSGELLAQVYLEQRKSLLIEQAGGAQARVIAVEIAALERDKELSTDKSLTIKASWLVQAQVGHWGHQHQRQNRYEAQLLLTVVDRKWKITAMEILDQKRM